jgi:tRNA(Arg) A34 adenosine deaminase TadA
MSEASSHPPRPIAGRLHDVWERPVKDLVLLPTPEITAAQQERHTLYSLLVMALVAFYWNGNKRGGEGEYPWRAGQRRQGGHGYVGGDYLGHNIACIAVDGTGAVIDFDFNHNDLLNSSVEHAESRLVRRVFSLTQIYDDWATRSPSDPPKSVSYSNLLSEVTIYTSLESCSQCSGIMALGSVKDVVFLHRDPGQSSIGNILRNLSPVGGRYMPPLPIPGDSFGLAAFATLEREYARFEREVGDRPFHVPPVGKPDKSPSITSFLCTDEALAVFAEGGWQLEAMTSVQHPQFVPACSNGETMAATMPNADVLEHVKRFYRYATTSGRRGTPHKL